MCNIMCNISYISCVLAAFFTKLRSTRSQSHADSTDSARARQNRENLADFFGDAAYEVSTQTRTPTPIVAIFQRCVVASLLCIETVVVFWFPCYNVSNNKGNKGYFIALFSRYYSLCTLTT